MQRQHTSHASAKSEQNPFKAPESQWRPDAEIRAEIQRRLSEDPLLDITGIFVSVSSGRVLLEGSVENDEVKRRIETHSRQVSGISGHDSNLCVRKPR
ncbi:BON domain-containing protein (plasmid) [Rhizobium sp. CB3090]|uniref:BON domain-containing protein n=1 Tax=Rhizobium sp. CB3090 TaxID=3039156 RepID=UPI0024B06C6A|nr:BON domain-containing protein [Rhizobium sp. CB3090]WFU11351.1 BON domain-containing protein [Rhizobium sp. CB3090]